MFKKITSNLLLLIFSILITFFVLEIGMRVYQSAKYGTPIHTSQTAGLWQRASLDPELGWRNTENYSVEKILEDAKGDKYVARVTTGKYGFKLFETNNGNTRIFIVGDSFTDASEVSNEKTYWAVLADKFKNLQFYVYGCGGYGNLQEFMIIDKYLNEIKPQIIILQLSVNDFINNDYMLESNSYIHNNGLRRPYLDSAGKIFYKNPRHLKILPEYLITHSRLFYDFNYQTQILYYYLRSNNTIEKEIGRIGNSHKDFRHSAELTRRIMQKIKERVPSVKIYAFCADYAQLCYDEFKQIALSEDFAFIDGIPQAVKLSEDSGYVTKSADKAHWNEFGHKIVGEKLAEYFLNHGLAQPIKAKLERP